MERDTQVTLNNCRSDLLYQNRVHSKDNNSEDLEINFHDTEAFVNNISWSDKEGEIDNYNDDDDDDSSINITIHSQDDLSLVGLFSTSSDNCRPVNCDCFYNNFFCHQIDCSICFHKSRFQNLLKNDNQSIEGCVNPFCYINMANKFSFLPRQMEIEAARKRKCDCSLHGKDIKKFHSRTESLKDLYRATDAITAKVKDNSAEEEIVTNSNATQPWTSSKEEVVANNSISYPASSTPNKEVLPKIPLTCVTFGYKFEDFKWRKTNIENNVYPMKDEVTYTDHSLDKGLEGRLAPNPHYESSEFDFSVNSDALNTNVNSIDVSKTNNNSNMSFTSLGNSPISENNSSISCLESISINKSGYPVIKKFKNIEERIKWLNETEFQTGFIDTHCHLDFLFRKLNYSQSFESYISSCQETEPFPQSFKGCIAVFCDPRSFFKFTWWQTFLLNDNVWGAFGCHPHFTHQFGPDEENMLRYALANEKVIATGEIGLDYSRKNGNDHKQQISVFKQQLEIALEVRKPIVIHCRDAFEDAYTIMKTMLPKNYTIHLHCFTGSFTEAINWMESFPNLYFGFTSIITQDNMRAINVKQIVRALPLNRILLETDSPYFRPYYMKKGNYSHPGMAIHVASAISTLRQIPIEVVLKETRKNTFNVYKI